MTLMHRLKTLEQRKHQTQGIAGMAERMRRIRMGDTEEWVARTPEELAKALAESKPGSLARRMLEQALRMLP